MTGEQEGFDVPESVVSDSLPDFDENQTLITLTHSPPIWSLPASSARCLESMLYLQMCKIPFSKKASSYHTSAKGDLPHLHQFREVHGADSYMEFLKTSNEKWDLDISLNRSDRILSSALSSHVRQTLSLIVSFMMWVEPENKGHTAKAVGATLPVFIRQILLLRRQRDAQENCKAHGFTSAEKCKKELQAVLQDLSELLGDKMYFFEDKKRESTEPPCSSLDAVVGGQLLFLFYSGVPVNYVEDLKLDIQNLKDFAYRLLTYDMHAEDNLAPQTPRLDSGFLRDAFLENPPLSVDDFWEAQRLKREEETEISDDEPSDKKDEPQSLINFDEQKKSWLFLAGTVATVVFYIGWYKNIRGIRIEIQ